jgi:bifunctional DNase/RNase
MNTSGSLSLEELSPDTTDLVELFPKGIALAQDFSRPFLILKDQRDELTLPVWMHPLDASLSLAELGSSTGVSPHAVTRRILSALDLRIVACRIVRIQGHHLFAELEFASDENSDSLGRLQGLSVRADETMALCLQAGARFYSSRQVIRAAQRVQTEMAALESQMKNHPQEMDGPLGELRPEISSKKFPYMM